MTYDFDDILITPAEITEINSRSEVNPFYGNKLPLFAAPMDTVVNRYNMGEFLNNGIKVCLPREATITPHHYSLNEDVFYSYSLADFRAVFLGEDHIKDGKFYALIDVANGHMPAVRDAVVEAKTIYGERLQLMVGNVANPMTYALLSNAGADYVRVGIGNGCFIDGSIITTINGKKPIEDVVIGDYVLTHKYNYKEVVGTKRFEYTGELIKINDYITCTPDHEFYVRYYCDVIDPLKPSYGWVTARWLHDYQSYYTLVGISDYIAISKIEKYTDTVYVNDLSVLDDNSYTVNDIFVHNCGCLTTQQTGVGYPMASLIEACYSRSMELSIPAKIVADGGFKKYADVIKALALGCFLPHAEILTNTGNKKITDVKVGDYVLTHKNRFKRVINRFEYDNDKKIIEINGIPSTENHHYYVINKKYYDLVNEDNIEDYAEWLPANKLTDGYLLIDLSK